MKQNSAASFFTKRVVEQKRYIYAVIAQSDDLILRLIRAHAAAAETRIANGTYGKCANDSSVLPLDILWRNPMQAYCEDCDEKFSSIAEQIFSTRIALKKDLILVEESIKTALLQNSENSSGKEAPDVNRPDTHIYHSRRQRLIKEILQCEEVLLEISSGTYDGLCKGNCGYPLSAKRLELKPYAKFCVDCIESKNASTRSR